MSYRLVALVSDQSSLNPLVEVMQQQPFVWLFFACETGQS
jgi:hypothetical protein